MIGAATRNDQSCPTNDQSCPLMIGAGFRPVRWLQKAAHLAIRTCVPVMDALPTPPRPTFLLRMDHVVPYSCRNYSWRKDTRLREGRGTQWWGMVTYHSAVIHACSVGVQRPSRRAFARSVAVFRHARKCPTMGARGAPGSNMEPWRFATSPTTGIQASNRVAIGSFLPPYDGQNGSEWNGRSISHSKGRACRSITD